MFRCEDKGGPKILGDPVATANGGEDHQAGEGGCSGITSGGGNTFRQVVLPTSYNLCYTTIYLYNFAQYDINTQLVAENKRRREHPPISLDGNPSTNASIYEAPAAEPSHQLMSGGGNTHQAGDDRHAEAHCTQEPDGISDGRNVMSSSPANTSQPDDADPAVRGDDDGQHTQPSHQGTLASGKRRPKGHGPAPSGIYDGIYRPLIVTAGDALKGTAVGASANLRNHPEGDGLVHCTAPLRSFQQSIPSPPADPSHPTSSATHGNGPPGSGVRSPASIPSLRGGVVVSRTPGSGSFGGW